MTDAEFYGAYLPVLKQTEQLLLSELQQILERITPDAESAPAEHIRFRLKSPESVLEKLRRKELPETAVSALNHLSDLVGIRIVTHFIGDVYSVLDALQENPNWKIVKIKDYIAQPKENGYRSLHIILSVPADAPQLHDIRAEIQLRTIAMDCWASLEHQMKYKKHIENAALISAELKRCADEMASTDLSMQTIRRMIGMQ